MATMLAGMVMAAPSGTAAAGTGTALTTQSKTAAKTATHKVIVLLKDQPKIVSARSSAFKARRSQILKSQAPLAAQLKSSSKNVRSYQLLNAMAATVSTSEESKLQADPAVSAVIPDEVIKAPAATDKAAAAAPTRTAPAGTCPTGSSPLLEPEALGVTHTQSDDPKTKTARSLGYTGAGVKVAFMAEGIDVNNQDFIRADGTHVFTDYQDFSSDGTDAPTDGAEAFLDASAIAAQGLHSYNIQNFSAVPLTKPCDIRVEGMAPGASLIGLKVFAQNNATTTSAFLQAIDYAVNTDKVDVLNQSFGGNPFPDIATSDAVAMFDEAAVQAGVTVVASSGDAGPTNTIGSPASDPDVLSVGASTTYRFYAQTGYGGYYPLAKAGWLNDNVSPLSSSGLTESGRTIDMLAPGDLDFALCTANPDLYEGCTNLAGAPSPVEESGGTSESAPLTSGAAALVIEAYRHSHGGSSPSPAEVKELLTSTSDDLGHPADEQGAGRLNAYQAVLAALSVHDSKGTPARTGSTLLKSKTQLDAIVAPGAKVTSTVKLTNNGSGTQTLALSQRTLGAALGTQTGSVTLSDSGKHFTDFAGQQTNYKVATFKIPSGRARLDVDYVYPGDPGLGLNDRVRLALIDPKGRFAAHSLPQGVGNAGHVDVRTPAGGTWTAMIWSRGSAVGGFTGKVTFKVATHNYSSAGSVSPASVKLAAGASKTITVHSTAPGKPGDQSNSLAIKSSSGQLTSVPVALRSLVNLKTGGKYSGVLTGGNGRSSNTGQAGYYQFTVPKGEKDLTANFTLSGGAKDPVFGYLVDPDGNAQAYGSDSYVSSFDSQGDPIAKSTSTMSMFVRAPKAGRWSLLLNFTPTVAGTVLSRPFSGTLVLNKVAVSAAKLPDSSSTKLAADTPVTVPVKVKNTGVAPQSFFIDPRLNGLSDVQVPDLATGPFTLPLTPTSSEPEWMVPTETTKVQVGVSSTAPVNFDFGWLFGFGDPDIAGTSSGTTATGTYTGSPVPSGAWFAAPADLGPFGAGAAPAATADATLTATTLSFDPAVTTDIGDFEATSLDPATPFQVVTVAPGKTATIPVTITPTGTKGDVVSGKLFVDDLSFVSVLGALPAGQELHALPYRYTIG